MTLVKKKKKKNLITFISSAGVFSGISRKITIQRLWLGRTLCPSSSTWTFGDSATQTLFYFQIIEYNSYLELNPIMMTNLLHKYFLNTLNLIMQFSLHSLHIYNATKENDIILTDMYTDGHHNVNIIANPPPSNRSF
jgi:hypothetical protein